MIYHNTKIRLIKYRDEALREGMRGFFFASRVPHIISGVINHPGNSRTISMIRESDNRIINKNVSDPKKYNFSFHTLYAVTNDSSLFKAGDMIYYTVTKKVKIASEGLLMVINKNKDKKYWKLIAPLFHDDWDRALHSGVLFGDNLCDVEVKGKNAYITSIVTPDSGCIIIGVNKKENIYNYLKKHATGGMVITSSAKMARGLGIGESTIIKCTKQLIENGSIVVEKVLGKKGTRYKVLTFVMTDTEICQDVISDSVI